MTAKVIYIPESGLRGVLVDSMSVKAIVGHGSRYAFCGGSQYRDNRWHGQASMTNTEIPAESESPTQAHYRAPVFCLLLTGGRTGRSDHRCPRPVAAR